MNTYLGYVRVSTPRQGEGVSLQEQRSAIEAHARAHGLQISGWFEEQESASKQGRRVFNQVLRELEKGRAAGVIIHKIDRSARHLKDWAWLGELIDNGVDVRFAHENLDLTSRGGRLTADLLAVLAADYSRNLRDEVRKGLYGRLKQGLYPWRAPIGYLDQGAGKPKALDPLRAPLIRQAFELYAERRFTIDTLRDELERRGLRRACGRSLSRNGVHLVLNNSFYAGLIKIAVNGQTYEGVHTPLISLALFDQVQRVLAGKTNTRLVTHDFVFRRMLTCAACDRTLTGERQKGRVYYRCHTPACRGTSIRESRVFDDLRAFLSLVALSPEDLVELRDFVESDGVRRESAGVERARLQRAVAFIDERLERLTDAVVDGLIDKEAFETRKSALLHEKRSYLDQEAASLVTGSPGDRLLKKFELGNAAYVGLNSEIASEIRDGVLKTTSNLSVRRNELEIAPLSPFLHLAKQRLVSFGGAYWNVLRTGSTICLTGKALPPPSSIDRPLFLRIAAALEQADKNQVDRQRSKS